MANPQVEDGYTRIANDLLEAMIRAGFSQREWALTMTIIRATYGWSQKATTISKLELFRRAGLDKSHGYRTLKHLKGRRVLYEIGRGIGIQKDYDQWQPSTRAQSALVPKQHYHQKGPSTRAEPALGTSAELALQKSRKRPSGAASQAPKERSKEITKERGRGIPSGTEGRKTEGLRLEDFDAFWAAYPRRVKKLKAVEAWKKVRGVSLEKILKAVEEQKTWEQWRKDNGQFIPYPATWLNQGQWDDEPTRKPRLDPGPAWGG